MVGLIQTTRLKSDELIVTTCTRQSGRDWTPDIQMPVVDFFQCTPPFPLLDQLAHGYIENAVKCIKGGGYCQ